MRPSLLSALALVALACARHYPMPDSIEDEASVGRCRAGVDRARACGEWVDAVAACDGDAADHGSFPELDPASCFVPVRYRDGALPAADATPPGCGYPKDDSAAWLTREAARYEAVAAGAVAGAPMPVACDLPAADRRAAAAHNAAALRQLGERLRTRPARYPYAAVATFGFGHPAMDASVLVPWRPGDACVPLDKREMDRLSVNRVRAGRAAAAWHGGVAPVITVSGGAVHASLYEAFLQLHLLACTFAVPPEAVLLDPCADHTHTNVRNTGSLLLSLGGRTAYVVTDDGLQSGYLQEWTVFTLIGGSIQQRALRDWGYGLGSWRQASIGMDAGFWFTPYRFWGEPHDGLGSLTCVN